MLSHGRVAASVAKRGRVVCTDNALSGPNRSTGFFVGKGVG
ncbi:hypothetical protein AF71_00061980 [Rhizobium sp. 57MFTsu3.2]|nr:hypothetical protein [Rhizobium sp. 57MFTsu3.2]